MEIARRTQRLPADVLGLLVEYLPPGLCYDLRSLPEFAPLVGRRSGANGYEAARYGASVGHLGLLQTYRRTFEGNVFLEVCLCAAAARENQIAVLQWVFDEINFGAGSSSIVWEHAIQCGHLEVLEYLDRVVGPEFELMPHHAALAVQFDRIEVLKWMVARGYRFTWHTFRAALAGGHLDSAIWLHENGGPFTGNCCSVAAEYGQLEVLKWLRRAGYPFHAPQVLFAAQSRHQTHIEQWLREEGHI